MQNKYCWTILHCTRNKPLLRVVCRFAWEYKSDLRPAAFDWFTVFQLGYFEDSINRCFKSFVTGCNEIVPVGHFRTSRATGLEYCNEPNKILFSKCVQLALICLLHSGAVSPSSKRTAVEIRRQEAEHASAKPPGDKNLYSLVDVCRYS